MDEVGGSRGGSPDPTPRVKRAWYALACATDVGGAPVRRHLHGAAIVLFRDQHGGVGALVDACPHRRLPLSDGVVVDGDIQCPHHHWRFDREGRCTALPGYDGKTDHPARRARAWAVRERQGLVWVWGDLGSEPAGEPPRLHLVDHPDYAVERVTLTVAAGLAALAARALAAAGGPLEHGPTSLQRASPGGPIHRFHAPSLAEVDHLQGDVHVQLYAALTPARDGETHVHAVVCVRAPAGHARPDAAALLGLSGGAAPHAERVYASVLRLLSDAAGDDGSGAR